LSKCNSWPTLWIAVRTQVRNAFANALRERRCRGSLPKCHGPQREPRRRAADLVRRTHVAALVDAFLRQLLQEMELAEVEALLRQEVVVARDNRRLLIRPRPPLQPARVRPDQDCPLLLPQPLGRFQVDPGAVVLPQLVVVAAVLAPVAQDARA